MGEMDDRPLCAKRRKNEKGLILSSIPRETDRRKNNKKHTGLEVAAVGMGKEDIHKSHNKRKKEKRGRDGIPGRQSHS